MTNRVHNFGAGPAAVPLAVLEQAREELLDFKSSGRSILESSHRGPEYTEVHEAAVARLRRLLGAGDDWAVLFMTGGARTQFSAVPMHFLVGGGCADYLVTGRWSQLALQAAARFGAASAVWNGEATGFDRVPLRSEWEASPQASYLHYTSNNTIYGTQFSDVPGVADVPVIADVSSDILSAPIELDRFGLIYAGAQKNLGVAGVTVVVVRHDLIADLDDIVPDTLCYSRMAAKNSLLNTPPVFAIYFLDLVLEELEKNGGAAAAEERNRAKAELLYRAIDESDGFYRGHADTGSRSRMNVTFRLPNEELETRFLTEAEDNGLVGLRGHRSVGGARASIYNAVEVSSVRVLTEFMRDFARRSG